MNRNRVAKKVIHAYTTATRRIRGVSCYRLVTKESGSTIPPQPHPEPINKTVSREKQVDHPPKPCIQPGSMKEDVLTIADDFDAPLVDFEEYT